MKEKLLKANNCLIQDIKSKLKIEGSFFIDAELQDYIKDIPQDKYLEFFKALSGGEYEYKNAMDRVAMTAKKFKDERTDKLLEGTREQAKAMYDKFYAENAYMLDYCTDNRSRIPNDREFFKSVPYGELKRTDGTKTYSNQELYVLNALGGGEWLLDIRLALSSKEIIDKIEKTIKQAVMTKYNQNQIENKKVQNLIGGIKDRSGYN